MARLEVGLRWALSGALAFPWPTPQLPCSPWLLQATLLQSTPGGGLTPPASAESPRGSRGSTWGHHPLRGLRPSVQGTCPRTAGSKAEARQSLARPLSSHASPPGWTPHLPHCSFLHPSLLATPSTDPASEQPEGFTDQKGLRRCQVHGGPVHPGAQSGFPGGSGQRPAQSLGPERPTEKRERRRRMGRAAATPAQHLPTGCVLHPSRESTRARCEDRARTSLPALKVSKSRGWGDPGANLQALTTPSGLAQGPPPLGTHRVPLLMPSPVPRGLDLGETLGQLDKGQEGGLGEALGLPKRRLQRTPLDSRPRPISSLLGPPASL
ncbi:uncharacterized protein LOC125618082 [Marmota marmota marmota]|uniref:uncharacterized protein LOC125618082 n=1 Tax=Marmota marmota marmota TaxID=9994 RepID=UPI0020920226|nr:uncharacterized protein LOC125618082 [Marmota marmota marmota]XP_048663775.1 uncharacterized protein LOC125618082 [Marmota marmota marmota]